MCMRVCIRDLQCSTFCVSRITAKIWLDTILYHGYHSKNSVSLFIENQTVVEFVTDKLISKILYYKYRLLIPL